MGCDGGTIPKRHELVKTAKRGEQKDKDMDRTAKWTLCTISQQPLTQPIMMCELGKLYNKEAIIEYLLDKSISSNCLHVATMKHVKQLNLTLNTDYKTNKSSECHDEYFDTQVAQYVCPVVGLEMNGKYRFCALWECGCTMSERAMKEVDTETCHKCGETFENENVIIINAEGDELCLMEQRMRTRREKAKALKKAKKLEGKKGSEQNGEKDGKKRRFEDVGVGCSKSVHSKESEHVFEVPNIIPGKGNDTNNDTFVKSENKTENSTREVKDKTCNGTEEKRNDKKKRKREKDVGSSSKSKQLDNGLVEDKESGIGSREKLDHKQSSVYKKLFTSGNEKNAESAHWVTYNPYHL